MINNFNHIQTAHCENGVTVGLLKHYGFDDIDEPLVFGIGAGLFYIHIPFLKINNGPAISFRTMPGYIFKRTCSALGIKIIRKKFSNPEDAKSFLDAKIYKGKPVGCQVGVFHLPYFPPEYRFHFNAHNIIVYGKDETHYHVSDPVMEHTTSLTHGELEKVRFVKGVFAPRGHIYYPERFNEIDTPTIRKAIVSGIKTNTRHMLYVPGGIAGVKGIVFTSGKIRKWPKKLGVKRAGLYLAQIVRMQEEIGTGGGGFRFLYAAFLERASGILGVDSLMAASNDFTKSGDLWRSAAMQMAGIYKGRLSTQKDFDEVADLFLEIYQIEKSAFKKIEKLKLKA